MALEELADDAFPQPFGSDSSHSESDAGAPAPTRSLGFDLTDVGSEDPVVLGNRVAQLALALRTSQVQQQLAEAKIQATAAENGRLQELLALHSAERAKLVEVLKLLEAERAREDGSDAIRITLLRGELLEQKEQAMLQMRRTLRRALAERDAVVEKTEGASRKWAAQMRALREANARMQDQIAQRTVLFNARFKETDDALRLTRQQKDGLRDEQHMARRECADLEDRAGELGAELRETKEQLAERDAQLADERHRSASLSTQAKQMEEDLTSAKTAMERLDAELQQMRNSSFSEVERAMYTQVSSVKKKMNAEISELEAKLRASEDRCQAEAANGRQLAATIDELREHLASQREAAVSEAAVQRLEEEARARIQAYEVEQRESAQQEALLRTQLGDKERDQAATLEKMEALTARVEGLEEDLRRGERRCEIAEGQIVEWREQVYGREAELRTLRSDAAAAAEHRLEVENHMRVLEDSDRIRQEQEEAVRQLAQKAKDARRQRLAAEERLVKLKEIFKGKLERLKSRFHKRLKRLDDQRTEEMNEILRRVRERQA